MNLINLNQIFFYIHIFWEGQHKFNVSQIVYWWGPLVMGDTFNVLQQHIWEKPSTNDFWRNFSTFPEGIFSFLLLQEFVWTPKSFVEPKRKEYIYKGCLKKCPFVKCHIFFVTSRLLSIYSLKFICITP